jgi:hypothetical protein
MVFTCSVRRIVCRFLCFAYAVTPTLELCVYFVTEVFLCVTDHAMMQSAETQRHMAEGRVFDS